MLFTSSASQFQSFQFSALPTVRLRVITGIPEEIRGKLEEQILQDVFQLTIGFVLLKPFAAGLLPQEPVVLSREIHRTEHSSIRKEIVGRALIAP